MSACVAGTFNRGLSFPRIFFLFSPPSAPPLVLTACSCCTQRFNSYCLEDKTWRGTSKQAVACSYNVLEYASEPHEAYTRHFGGGRALGRALIVGMNPGPWGMVSSDIHLVAGDRRGGVRGCGRSGKYYR